MSEGISMLDALIDMFDHPQQDIAIDRELCRSMADGLRDIRREFAESLAAKAETRGRNIVALPLRREYFAAEGRLTARPVRVEISTPDGGGDPDGGCAA